MVPPIVFPSITLETSITFAVVAYLILNVRRNKVTLDYQRNPHNQHILKQCPSIYHYKPTVWLNGLLHTIVSTILPIDNKIEATHEKIENTGISIDWASQCTDDKTLIFILPGLTGSIKDSYINSQVRAAIDRGFKNICVYNYRILSKEANYFFKPSHQDYNLNFKPNPLQDEFKNSEFAGIDTDYHFFQKERSEFRVDLMADLHHTLTYLKQKYRFEKIAAIGSSYGAMQLCNYLGRFHDVALIDCGVSVGAPYSLLVSSKFMSKFMDKILTWNLQSKLKSFRHVFDNKKYPQDWKIDLEKALAAKRLREFDSAFIIGVYGYRSVYAYYRHMSPLNHMLKVKVPLLCISSQDDDVCHIKSVCKDEILLNPRAILCTTGLGGHIGFVQGRWWPKEHWFPKPAMEFISASLESK